MEKYEKILYKLNQQKITSQRALAKEMQISLGQVNYLLKELSEQGYLEKSDTFYKITLKGKEILEKQFRKNQEQKLDFGDVPWRIRTAVFLAAGSNKEFEKPEGLLEIGGIPLIEHMITALHHQGIERFVVVVGSRKEEYAVYFANRDVRLVENSRYKWTGTMASLMAAKEYLTEDFLLVEGNQIVEEIAFENILMAPQSNCMLLVSPSNSMDEAYVELDEEGRIFRISKDIKQLNRVDGELTGICKISHNLFQKMIEYYGRNQNPLLNYEYAIESIGRIYNIQGIVEDDLIWSVIENEKLYRKASDILYPKMKKRSILRQENNAKEILVTCLGLQSTEVEKVSIGGGMTNQNFYIKTKSSEYILRIPGACTQQIIEREKEQYNGNEASKLGLNPVIRYFNPQSGVKVTDYIQGARTLNPGGARLEVNMRLTTDLLKRLHNSNISLKGEFSPWTEYEKYKSIIQEARGSFYTGFGEIEPFFWRLQRDLKRLGAECRPCHNDLVAENFVADAQGKMYLIDWEYAGMNDPLWDIASHVLECEFTEKEEELYLQYYFDQKPTPAEKQRLALFKICQDVLWSTWTMMKETKGEDFGTYGRERLARAIKQAGHYKEEYEQVQE